MRKRIVRVEDEVAWVTTMMVVGAGEVEDMEGEVEDMGAGVAATEAEVEEDGSR